MRVYICPTCEHRLTPEEVADGWCDTCGKRIPRYVLSGTFDFCTPPDGEAGQAALGAGAPDETGNRDAIIEPSTADPGQDGAAVVANAVVAGPGRRPADVCPFCGTTLPPVWDAFCTECRSRLEAEDASSPGWR